MLANEEELELESGVIGKKGELEAVAREFLPGKAVITRWFFKS